MHRRYFEDIEVGEELVGDTVEVDRDKMIAMAEEFDSLAVHHNADEAKRMGFGDIIASGADIFGLGIKAVDSITRSFHFIPSGRGIEVSFVRPVYAGDKLTAFGKVVSMRRSDKGNRGWVVVEVEYKNQAGETSAQITWPWLVRTRPEA